jgi:S1-C subfamily serine protease
MEHVAHSAATGSYLSQRLPWILLLLVLAALAVRAWLPKIAPLGDPDAQPRPITPRGDLAADEKSTIELFRRASPSVVHIATSTVRRDVFSFNPYAIPHGTGTGFIWDTDGHVVTNYHVIEGANAARVTLSDHSFYDAALVGIAPEQDLAVLKIDAPAASLRPIMVGTSHDLEVGQKVFAIGNPFGLDQTLTTGVISGLGREIETSRDRTIRGVIQTDAAINPGNSGGPLLDSAGRLIGVNTAIYSPTGAYAGVGFAVPVDTVNRVVPQILRYGRAIRPGIGATFVPDHAWRRPGVVVLSVAPGSAAARAGLRPTQFDRRGRLLLGDVILAVDGQAVNTVNDLYAELEERQVGATVRLTVLRGGRQTEIEVLLEAE